MAGLARLQVSLHGTVQGVGFRWWARRQAQLLGCTGYVRNDPSGTRVELVAEGPRETLEQLLDRVKEGPSGARVTHVEAEWQENTGEFGQFQIRQ
ncbi:MAG TPA: acylphosphatase [Chloroflexota bacterium]|nr:acylphosphatase [Chloroflexota bacterium]